MSGRHLRISLTPSGAWYVAQCLDIDIASQGRSRDDAMTHIEEALELYFEDIPLPDGIERDAAGRLPLIVEAPS